MIKLKSLLTENQRTFRGDCRTILDRDDLFDDATEMAQAVENSEAITYQQFMSLADLTGINKLFKLKLRRETDPFDFAQYKDLVWAYDKDTDIHYFFL